MEGFNSLIPAHVQLRKSVLKKFVQYLKQYNLNNNLMQLGFQRGQGECLAATYVRRTESVQRVSAHTQSLHSSLKCLHVMSRIIDVNFVVNLRT